MDLTLEVTVSEGGAVRAHRFSSFPVTFGRDACCDLRLDHPSVSRIHGTIELRDGVLVLVDGGGRNGTYSDGVKLAHGEAVVIEHTPRRFRVDGTVLTLRAAPATPTLSAVRPHPSTALYANHNVDPTLRDRHGFAYEALAAYAAARDEALSAVRGAVASLPEPERRFALLRQLATELPELACDPELQEFAAGEGVELRAQDVVLGEAALHGLRDLVFRVRLPSPENAANVTLLFDNIVDILQRLFVGLAMLQSIERGRGSGTARVHAENGALLARRVLDWRNWSYEPTAWLDKALGELALRMQRAEEGCRSELELLAQELSPSAVEATRGCDAKGWFCRPSFGKHYRAVFARSMARLSARFGSPPTAAMLQEGVGEAPALSHASGERHAQICA